MKHKKLSVKWKVFAYMLIFAAALIFVLWICQIVYLEQFYKFIKEREAKRAIERLSKELEQTDANGIQDCLRQIAADSEICILIADDAGNELYTLENAFGCTIHTLRPEELAMYYELTRENNGKLTFTSEESKMRDEPALMPPPEQRPIEKYLLNAKKGGREGMACALIQTLNGRSCLILTEIRLTPVDATVHTLRVQLLLISLILLLLALLMAFLISRAVSKPIISVNQAAKELAKGNYQTAFDGRSYLEINELSETLHYAAKELAKTEQYQRELIANVSHDLRTPLTMITAYSEVMRDLPGENTPENIQVIIEEAERLTNLVNDMLDISKLQSGALEKNETVYDLTRSVERVLERYVKLKEQDGYQIEFLYQEHAFVKADEFKIFQVLYNLINNAINYTGADKKVIVRQIIENQKARIEIEDTGPGIAEEDLPNVWERYYKAKSSHKRAVKGSGLGLSIVKNILMLHQARFGVDSKPGKGSVFWFELETVKITDN